MTFHDFSLHMLTGKPLSLSLYSGHPVLAVNVASKCGLTPQYAQLQAMHETLEPKGLRIVGFPCNDFGKQEPGTPEEIGQFCTKNYGVEFDITEKIHVNGPETHPLYKDFLKSKEHNRFNPGDVQWNFQKYLISKDGKVIGGWNPQVKPNAPEIVEAIEAALK